LTQAGFVIPAQAGIQSKYDYFHFYLFFGQPFGLPSSFAKASDDRRATFDWSKVAKTHRAVSATRLRLEPFFGAARTPFGRPS